MYTSFSNALSIKDTNTGEDSALLHSCYQQLNNYLLAIKRQYGISTPFGMLTAYNEFKICWLGKNEGINHIQTLYISENTF